MRRKIIKSIYLSVVIVCLALLVTVFFINKPSEIRVSAYTKSYSINSKNNIKDSIDIEILVDQAESFFNDKNQIESSYIKGEGGEIKLIIKEIYIENANIYIYDEKFYIFHYIFEIEFSTSEEFVLFIDNANLNLNFLNGINSSIKIGSFSYYKYSESSEDLMISLLKGINNYQNDTNLYGFQIGLRNISTYEINIKNIKLLDTNAIIGKPLKLDEVSESRDILDFFPNYNNIHEVLEFDLSIMSKENIYYVVPLLNMDNYNLMHPLEKIGFLIEYEINGENKTFIFENFIFYEQNYVDYSKFSFEIYTYDNY